MKAWIKQYWFALTAEAAGIIYLTYIMAEMLSK
jgi:hypothetical protein